MNAPALATALLCCGFFLISSTIRNVSADSYSDYFSDYDCNQPLMEHAVLTATSSLNDRGPEKARLNGYNYQTPL